MINARDNASKIAMFRYQLIRDAADPALSSRQRGAAVRALAARTHTDPFGNQVTYSRDHLDRWIRAWRTGGFDALLPAARTPYLRTDADVLATAVALKREQPGRTATQIQRILAQLDGWAPSQSTLLRHFHRVGLAGPGAPVASAAAGGQGEVFGRFEADHPNELWTGDALHGPRIAGRKTYLPICNSRSSTTTPA